MTRCGAAGGLALGVVLSAAGCAPQVAGVAPTPEAARRASIPVVRMLTLEERIFAITNRRGDFTMLDGRGQVLARGSGFRVEGTGASAGRELPFDGGGGGGPATPKEPPAPRDPPPPREPTPREPKEPPPPPPPPKSDPTPRPNPAPRPEPSEPRPSRPDTPPVVWPDGPPPKDPPDCNGPFCPGGVPIFRRQDQWTTGPRPDWATQLGRDYSVYELMRR